MIGKCRSSSDPNVYSNACELMLEGNPQPWISPVYRGRYVIEESYQFVTVVNQKSMHSNRKCVSTDSCRYYNEIHIITEMYI